MKRLLIFLIALAAALAVLLTGSPTAQAHSARPAPTHKVVTYVALGDSYSAGVGNGDYDPASGACLRSAKAYPKRLAARYHRLDLIDFKACDGATTDQLIANQLPATPNADVETVTVTIGGNDVGTFSVLPDCMGLDGVPGCSQAAKTLFAGALEQLLPAKMALALSAIHTAYPKATIHVGGYMELFGNRNADCKVGELNGQSFSINVADKAWLNLMARKLNTAIRKAVHQADATMRARFVDVSHVFNGHGLCDSARPWVGNLDATNLKSLLHPTARGQRAYAQRFHAAGVGR
jgi:lysophospholipase L1-like esterase